MGSKKKQLQTPQYQKHTKQYNQLLSKREPVCKSPFPELDWWDKNIGTFFKWFMFIALIVIVLLGLFNLVQINMSSTKLTTIATIINEVGIILMFGCIGVIGILSLHTMLRPTTTATSHFFGIPFNGEFIANVFTGLIIGGLGASVFGFMIWVLNRVADSTVTDIRKFTLLILAMIAMGVAYIITVVKNKQFSDLIITIQNACTFYRPIRSSNDTLFGSNQSQQVCKGRNRSLQQQVVVNAT